MHDGLPHRRAVLAEHRVDLERQVAVEHHDRDVELGDRRLHRRIVLVREIKDDAVDLARAQQAHEALLARDVVVAVGQQHVVARLGEPRLGGLGDRGVRDSW